MCNSLLCTVRNVAYALFASAASDAHGGGAEGGGVGGQHWHNERCVACDIRKVTQERDGEGAEAGGSREYVKRRKSPLDLGLGLVYKCK